MDAVNTYFEIRIWIMYIVLGLIALYALWFIGMFGFFTLQKKWGKKANQKVVHDVLVKGQGYMLNGKRIPTKKELK